MTNKDFPRSKPIGEPDSLSFLEGGGKMAALMRAHDWSRSPLGAPASWPQSLRSVVGLLLTSRFPMFVAWGPELGFLYNDAYAEVLGGKHPNALGNRFYDIWQEIWHDIGPRIDAALAGRATYDENLPLTMNRRGFDEQTWFTFSYSPVRDESGAVAGMFCVCTETTAQVLAEERRTADAQRLRQLLQQMPGFVGLLSGPEHRYDYVNDAYVAISGPRDFVGRTVKEVFPELEGQGFFELLDRVYATGEVYVTRDASISLSHVTDPRYIDFIYAPIRNDQGEVSGIFVGGYDVTERVRAERAAQRLNDTLEMRVAERTAELEQAQQALRQSQKMEAVGQLTGGIAHDFNNMLAVVIGSLDLLNRRLGDDPRARRYADAAMVGAKRAAQLTQRLLAFSRQQPLKPEPINVNRLVGDMSELIRRSLGSDVVLESVLSSGLWKVHADPNQLESAILNLAVNARDAMPHGGKLTVETQNAHIQERNVAGDPGLKAGQYVLIAITDTGAGMSEEVMSKAFDPFYTTKEVGKGTGLGLSQVYGFVKQSGGHVELYSQAGLGTTVKVYLPRFIGVEAEEFDEAAPGKVDLGENREAVLVVEDERTVRAFSVDALRELGYRVLEADGAATALQLLDKHPEIVLMFTDVVMPEVNGAKLAQEARRRRPDLRILFTTGYTRDAVVHNGVLDPGVEMLGKPFTIEELAAKVRAVIDGPA